MIYATYRFQEETNKFFISFANQEDIWPEFKKANSTFHLENAIKKAIKEQGPEDSPLEFHIDVADPFNDYLKIQAMIIMAFLRGCGYKDTVFTKGV